MNRRSFPRVRLNADAIIVTRSACFCGMLGNVSLCGMFVRANLPTGIGEIADITLPLPTASLHSSIELKGTVVRVDEDGIAYRISSIDHATFAQLKSILTNKSVRKLAA